MAEPPCPRVQEQYLWPVSSRLALSSVIMQAIEHKFRVVECMFPSVKVSRCAHQL